MRGLSTAVWSIVLVGSTASIAAGFVGGRSIGSAGALPVAASHRPDLGLPAPIRQRLLRRSLVGPHSLDAAGAFDPYGDPDLGVTDRKRPATGFDPRTDRARIAVIVVGAGGVGPGLDQFVKSPVPFTLAVAPGEDASGTLAQITAAGKTAIVDGSDAPPARVAALLHDGARGVIASLDEGRSAKLLRAIGHDALVVDAALAEDDDLGRIARNLHRRLFVRDVIADARDDRDYVDFMLRDALAIAQRSGTAIVAVHARTESFDAISRFADRAQRDGADIVALTDLDT